MILTRLRAKEVSDLEQALHRKTIQFGIADKAVDRLHDLVISQQSHIKELEYELVQALLQIE